MKKFVWLFPLFLLVFFFGGIVFWQKLYNTRSQAHLYVNLEGTTGTIFLDNQEIGTAPIKDFKIAHGFYELKIVTDHYQYTTTLRLSPQTATIIDWQAASTVENSSGLIYELLKLPKNESGPQLLINTIPDRATLKISGHEQLFFAPYQEILPAGDYQATLSLPGYQDLQLPFTLTEKYQLKITAKLAQSLVEQ